MQKIIIINGPNLNLLGKRETEIYGNTSFENFIAEIKLKYPNVELDYFQSNIEGELIDKIHSVGFDYDGIILNAAAYTHSSIALLDALKSVSAPTIEVHISNIYKRESFRAKSYIAPACIGSISGFGLMSYELALRAFINK